MNLETLITVLVSNVITGFLTYFAGKRKVDAETDNQLLKNLEISINLYKTIIDDLSGEIEILNVKIQELEDKIDRLSEENKRLKQSL